ncbi:pentapeptide repeat-containing protein [Streptomyces sp. NPDC050439]|uniref:pentapeptide repeat-containing protein n=1 Tax=unclassified Streptomyces TaxID=2593676 RepID=UPI003418E94F
MSDDHPAKKPRRWWHWSLVTAAALAFLALLIWGPWWIEGHHLKEGGKLVSSAGIIITGFRTMLIAIVAGLVAAAGLWYTHKSHQQTEKLFDHTREKDREQAELAREGQVTGRYVEAIKLLGSDKLHERLGGIYSLERIMNDSEKDHETVVEVLAALIRLQPADADLRARIAHDAQAALSVLGRRPIRPERLRINLTGADLRWADLDDCRLSGAIFRGADLTHARGHRAILDAANFTQAILVHTALLESSLRHADLIQTTLRHANFSRSDLAQANFIFTHMDGVTMTGTNLTDAQYLYEKMLLTCVLDEHTKLSRELANNPKIQERQR